MNKRSTLGGGTLLALALLFIGLTVLFNYALRGWRLDLTQNRLYTTAPGTDRVLASIKEPINLYFFFSAKTAAGIPDLNTYGVRVREFLQELVARSNGKLHLHVIDPQPFSEEEDRAAELGVRGVPVGGAGGQFYFGLAGTNATDGRAAIEFFDPKKEQFLEYDVVKLVYQLANPKKPVVAWLSTLPMSGSFDPRSGQPREPWMIYSDAQQLFEVRPLDQNATHIDPDVNVLVLVHPKQLSPATQFAIDQYALRGGHILLFVDPLAESDSSGAEMGNPMAAMSADKSSHLTELLTAWGVKFNPEEVVADRGHALSVTLRQGEQPVEHLGILGLDKRSFASADVITAGLSNVNVATAGYLEPLTGAQACQPVKGAGPCFEPLLKSGTDAAALPVARFRMLFDPATLLDGFKPTGRSYVIGARVSGNVHSAFPNGPPAGVTLPAGQTALKQSVKPLNLVVFADTDMLSDFMWVHEQNFFGQRMAQAWAGNGDLVENALDNLAGSADLISVRGRATFQRPFDRVERLRRSADERLHAKEQELEAQLRDTETKLTALQSKKDSGSSLILTPEQEQEIEHFQTEKLRIRKELRAVRAGLHEDIERLGTTLKIINIVLVPLLFAIVALAVWLWRRQRRRSAPAGAGAVAAEAHP
ncbi:MAG: Gldg family protein [Gammaproteobacteria bacterium]|nr:Gldg family protein [Gammaproteobacteria bacterium]MBV9724921.1 Gldg family protein [Gammaproteobacteria bacterium]